MKPQPKADTSHIQACRRLWLEHLALCPYCGMLNNYDSVCDAGKALHDELCSSITANRMCENLTATEATPCETGNSNQ